ncbi:MAG TPA: hypothetical protein VIM11_15015, partial [Tepidisphaeraceae bacterium]
METDKPSRPRTIRPAPALTATRSYPLLWIILTAGFTTLVIQWSLQHGKLAMYPFYDDVSYFMDALVRLQEFYKGGFSHLARGLRDRPPHSIFSCLLALFSYTLLGTHDWAPYAANGVIILALAGIINFLARGLPLWQRLILFLFVLTVPICQNAVYEFRPDIASALCAAAGAAVLLVQPFTTSSWKHRAAGGTLFGLAMLIKTPTFPLTMAVMFATLAVVIAADIILLKPFPKYEQLAIATGQTLGASIVVASPVYIFQFREIIAYIYEPIFGKTKDLWASHMTPREHLLYYLTGDGGATMLSYHVYLFVGIIVAGFALAAVFSRWDVVVRLAGFCVVTAVAYAIPTIMHVKQPFFATTFDWLLIFSAVYVLLWVCVSGHRLVAGVILGAALVAALAITHFIPELYQPGGANVVQRRRIISSVYNALVNHNVGAKARVYMTTTGYVNAAVLDYINLQQGMSAFNFAEQPYSADLKLHETEMENSDYVIASEQGNSESFGDFIPSGNMQDQTLAYVRNNPNFAEIAAIPTQNEKRFFVFKRVEPFYDWKVSTGLGPIEGPFPDWKLHEVRWGFGPKTVAEVSLPTAGQYHLIASGKAAVENTTVTVRIDGAEAGQHAFPAARFEAWDLPLNLTPGPHQIELVYSAWSKDGPRPMAVL